MSRETVEMVRLGVRPPADLAVMPVGAADGEELEGLRARMIALQGDLAQARAQRDATQGALDKANRDNDALRAELVKARAMAADFEELYRLADRAVGRFISRDEARALVDGGVEYYTEDEEE